jgi:hypothetical protein
MANCRKSYKQASGLKYHLTHSNCHLLGPKKKRSASESRSTSRASVPSPTSPASHSSPSKEQGINRSSQLGSEVQKLGYLGTLFRSSRKGSQDCYKYPKVDSAPSAERLTRERDSGHRQPSLLPQLQRMQHVIGVHPTQRPHFAHALHHAVPMYLQHYTAGMHGIRTTFYVKARFGTS